MDEKIEHYLLKITEEQRINLKILARYLLGLPKDYGKFHMGVFHIDKREWVNPFDDDDDDEPLSFHRFDSIGQFQKAINYLDNVDVKNAVIVHKSCNSIACAIGHGPIAGIKLTQDELDHCDNDWFEYSLIAFGVSNRDTDNRRSAFEWMFGGDWYNRDNTPKGAAQRVVYALNNGVPSNWRQQISGIEPLCYK